MQFTLNKILDLFGHKKGVLYTRKYDYLSRSVHDTYMLRLCHRIFVVVSASVIPDIVEAEIMMTSVITPDDEGHGLRRNDNYLRKCTMDPGLSIDTLHCFPFRFLDSKYNWLFHHVTNESF